AVEFLHSIKLIHTDLKPENVLLKSWEDRSVTLESGDVIRVPILFWQKACSSVLYCCCDWWPPLLQYCFKTRDMFCDELVLPPGNFRCRPSRLKKTVIDFGGATYEHDSHASVVNTRQYRAPEVILGLRWLYPSD
ncbi:unnamed protein product, partial [Ectocarpus sp. 13 AM-2016]